MTDGIGLRIEILHPGAEFDFSGAINRIVCIDLSEFNMRYGVEACFDNVMRYVEQARKRENEWDRDDQPRNGEILHWCHDESDCQSERADSEESPTLVLLGSPSEIESEQARSFMRSGGAFVYEKPRGYDEVTTDSERAEILKKDFESGFESGYEEDTFTERGYVLDGRMGPQAESDPEVYAGPPYQVSDADLRRLLHRAQMPSGWKKDD